MAIWFPPISPMFFSRFSMRSQNVVQLCSKGFYWLRVQYEWYHYRCFQNGAGSIIITRHLIHCKEFPLVGFKRLKRWRSSSKMGWQLLLNLKLLMLNKWIRNNLMTPLLFFYHQFNQRTFFCFTFGIYWIFQLLSLS